MAGILGSGFWNWLRTVMIQSVIERYAPSRSGRFARDLLRLTKWRLIVMTADPAPALNPIPRCREPQS